MKKTLSIFVAILFAFSISGLCFAQEAAKPASDQPKIEEKAPPAKANKTVKKTKHTKKAKTQKKPVEKKEGEPAPAGK